MDKITNKNEQLELSEQNANRSVFNCGYLADKMKAVFFDRDGVLNVDKDYLHAIEDFEWIEGAKESIVFLTRNNYTVFVVTNQSGIARGFYTIDDMKKLHDYMLAEIKEAGGHIEKFYFCPHLPEGKVKEYAIECDCRKPKPGLLLQALREYAIDKDKSFLIGDKPRDVESAEAAGIKGYLYTSGNLLQFVKEILNAK